MCRIEELRSGVEIIQWGNLPTENHEWTGWVNLGCGTDLPLDSQSNYFMVRFCCSCQFHGLIVWPSQ